MCNSINRITDVLWFIIFILSNSNIRRTSLHISNQAGFCYKVFQFTMFLFSSNVRSSNKKRHLTPLLLQWVVLLLLLGIPHYRSVLRRSNHRYQTNFEVVCLDLVSAFYLVYLKIFAWSGVSVIELCAFCYAPCRATCSFAPLVHLPVEWFVECTVWCCPY